MLNKISMRALDICRALFLTCLFASGTVSAANCLVDYHFFTVWPGGFQAEATITNLTPNDISGWNVNWTFQNGETVQNGWHGIFSWSGQQVSVTNPPDYNNVIPANGGSINIAFNGIGNNPVLLDSEAFTLNGMHCGEGQNPDDDKFDVQYELISSPVDVIENGVVIAKKFDVRITITNLTDEPVNGWTLKWPLKNDEIADSGRWWSNVSQDATGMAVAVNRWWNSTIPAGGSVTFNFEVMSPPEASIGEYDVPDFILNDEMAPPGEPQFFTLKRSGCSTAGVVRAVIPGSPDGDQAYSCRKQQPYDTCTEKTVPLGQEYQFEAFPVNSHRLGGILLGRFAGWAVNGTPVDDMTGIDIQHDDVVDAKFDCGGGRVENPYEGAEWHIDTDWQGKVQAQASVEPYEIAQKMLAVADTPTAIWLDSIASIEGTADRRGLEEHLDTALAHQKLSGNPVVVTVVIYNMPNRDCAANASAGEIAFSPAALAAIESPPYNFAPAISELPAMIERYRTDYLNPIVEIIGRRKYEDLRIVTIIEPDSLPNMATNIATDGRDENNSGTTDDIKAPKCVASNNGVVHPFSGSNGNVSWNYGDMQELSVQYDANSYVSVIQMALSAFADMSNVHRYLDFGHSGWLGWDNNVDQSVKLIIETVTHNGWGQYMSSRFDGIVSNVSGYTPLEEVYLPDPELDVSGASDLYKSNTSYYDYNSNFDEVDFHEALLAKFVSEGFNDDIGVLIDTSRNGWGGPDRPTSAPPDPENWTRDDYVAAAKIDLRSHRGNFCNPIDAGLGERPQASPVIPGSTLSVDAYVWVKPPGESDGTSDPFAPRFDPLCEYGGMVHRNATIGEVATDAMRKNDGAPAPEAGQWFDDQFRMLINNAYPPIIP